jgi:hypothetical protein
MQLIRFLLRKDQQFIATTAQSEVPKEVSFYELPVILDPYPQHAQLNQHGAVVVARPSVLAGDKYEVVTRAYIDAVHSVLTRKAEPSKAAADLEKRLIELTGFRKGEPSK